MRDLLRDYFDGELSRRAFFARLVSTGLSASAAQRILEAAELGQSAAAPPDGSGYRLSGTGGDLLVEQLEAAGTQFIFTNPGSLESAFFDALTDRPGLKVIVGLHEGIVIAMADGYHKVSRKTAFVNVHAAVGTAQMAGQMFNAHRDGSSLFVTAGMRDTTIYSDDLGLAPAPGFSQSDINRQFTKISWDLRTGASMALAARRALKVAASAPGGPVYVALSTDGLAERAEGYIWPKAKFLVEVRPRPAADRIEAWARMLIEARRPAPVFGDEVWKSEAMGEAVAICETLGLPAYASSTSFGFCKFPTDHPLFAGGGVRGPSIFAGGPPDLLMEIGTRDSAGGSLPDLAELEALPPTVAVGLDTNMLGRTTPVDLAIVADVREALKDLMAAVGSMATRERLAKIRDGRMPIVRAAVAERREARVAAARRNFEGTSIHPDRLDFELEQTADPNAIVVMENFTGKHDFLRFGHRPDEKTALHKAGSLGWGLGAAIGAKLAAPERQVVLSTGDGALMYSAAGFWTLARYKVPVLVVVSNNRYYQVVRNAFHRYGGRMAATGQYHGLYLGDPDIDFVKLAESQGVAGARVTAPAELAAALGKGIEATRDGNPYVLEVVVERYGPGADSDWHQRYEVGSQRTSQA